MKKTILIGLALLFFAGFYAYAQDKEIEETNMFVKTMPITRIYTHKLGYKVLYLKNDLNFGEFYIPLKWFDVAGNKGVIIRGSDPSYPYFSIFWKDGEFHSVKLYVKRDLRHESWGALTLLPDISEKFEVDELELEF